MKEILLTGGKIAIVDDEDYEHLNQWTWHECKGYATRTYWICTKRSNRKIGRDFMARVIMGDPEGYIVDHISGDTLDNRKQNLRLVTSQQNSWNQKVSTKRGRGLSKYKGVTKNGNGPKSWRSRIRVSDELISLGYFKSEEEAALAYNIAAQQYFGEYARLNVI